ncbi:MAG: OmpA family protein, partial [Tumebacillaceae bacterium]
ITYSDLITLLMIFFVIMYAMSSIDQTKFDSLSVSLNKSLSAENKIQMEQMGTSGITSRRPVADSKIEADPSKKNVQQGLTDQQKSEAQAQAEEQQRLDDLKKKIEKDIAENNLAGKVSVLDTDKGVQIILNDAALFESGSATLKEQALHVLGGMAPFLVIVPNKVTVEGHTDNVPISSGKFPSNWELSATRAINVVHFFESAGLPHDRLRAAGYADTQPLGPNDTDANRAANRRVNLIVERLYKPASISPIDKSALIQPN